MPQHNDEIYAGTSLQPLLDAQAAAMLPLLQRCAGDHALMLGTRRHHQPPPLPLLGCWTQMQLSGRHFHGDLHAAADEPLPFIDGAFDLVLLSQALDIAPAADELLNECLRMLAVDGTLVVTGIHPISPWAAWLLWRLGRKSMTLQLPAKICGQLWRAGLEIQTVNRVGSRWPRSTATKKSGVAMFGGAYILIARKRSRHMTPLWRQPTPLRVPAAQPLASAARYSRRAKFPTPGQHP